MIVIASLYIAGQPGRSPPLATWAQRKFVGERKPLEVSLVGNLDGGRNA